MSRGISVRERICLGLMFLRLTSGYVFAAFAPLRADRACKVTVSACSEGLALWTGLCSFRGLCALSGGAGLTTCVLQRAGLIAITPYCYRFHNHCAALLYPARLRWHSPHR